MLDPSGANTAELALFIAMVSCHGGVEFEGGTVSPEEANAFAQQWVAAWNDHDVERVLEDFADHVEFSSPLIASVLPGAAGTVVGKDALRRYWRSGIERFPDLRFEVLDVYTGVGSLVIRYRNQLGRCVCEYLEFDGGGKVIRGAGCYDISRSGGSG